MKALITGGSGFVGWHLVDVLKDRGYEVVIFGTRKPMFGTDSLFIYGDIENEAAFPRNDYDVVFHFAGLLGTSILINKAKESVGVNIQGTVNVLDWAKSNDTFVIQPNLLGDWLNTYMITKRCAERFGLMYMKEFGVPYLSIRPSDLFGPGQSRRQEKAAPCFIMKAINDEPIPIFGDGTAIVNYVFIKGFVKYIVDCFEKRMTGRLNYVRPHGNMTVKTFAEKIIDVADSKSALEYLPMRKGQPVGEPHPYIGLDDEDFVNRGYFIPLEKGLWQTIQWYKERYYEG